MSSGYHYWNQYLRIIEILLKVWFSIKKSLKYIHEKIKNWKLMLFTPKMFDFLYLVYTRTRTYI